MKTKKFDKKLSLNKTTVAHLGNVEMKDVKGGDLTDTCKTGCPTITCPVGCPPQPTDICPDIK